MIREMLKDETSQALRTLYASASEFYQTGSRFFGTHTSCSDFDFFATHTEELEDSLCSDGFVLDKSGEYNDPSLVCVLRKGEVHVQLVLSALVKNNVQSLIWQKREWFNTLTRSSQRTVWLLMVKACT